MRKEGTGEEELIVGRKRKGRRNPRMGGLGKCNGEKAGTLQVSKLGVLGVEVAWTS